MASLHYHKLGIGEIADQYGIEKDLLAQKIKEFSIDAASWITMLDHEGNIFVLKDMEALLSETEMARLSRDVAMQIAQDESTIRMVATSIRGDDEQPGDEQWEAVAEVSENLSVEVLFGKYARRAV